MRRGTAAQWTAANPVLAAGEPGAETDTGQLKLGDGTTAWSALVSPFAPSAGVLSSKGQTHKLLAKLYRGVDDAAILNVSDSTGVLTVRWLYMMTVRLAAMFPAYTVIYHLWDPTGLAAYDAGTSGTPVTIHTGTGAHTLHVWNFAISGQKTPYGLGSLWPTAIVPTDPDLIFVNHGKNEGTYANGLAPFWSARMLALTESLTAQFPTAGLVLILQPPTVDPTTRIPDGDMAHKATAYEQVALARGYGTINVHDAFMATGNPGQYMKADGIHQTDSTDVQVGPWGNGNAIWLAAVMQHMTFDVLAGGPRAQTPSTLTTSDVQHCPNGSFVAFAGALPDNWTASGATASKDVRVGYFESVNGYAVRIQATGAAASYLYQFVPGIESLRGKWVTVSMRVRVPSASYGGSKLPGRVGIYDGVTVMTATAVDAVDGFMWRSASMRVSTTAAYLRVYLYADTSANATADVTVDSVHLVLGQLPRLGAEGAVGPTGATGPAGAAAAGQIDYLSTLGTHPLVTSAVSNTATALVTANQAIFTPVIPHRNMTIAALEWLCGTQSGNYDIGLYDAGGTRLWSKGSTAWPTALADTVETVSPAVALVAGTKYWVAFAGDNTTGTFRGLVLQTPFLHVLDGTYHNRLVGSSFPLPSTVTLGSSFATRTPSIVLREA